MIFSVSEQSVQYNITGVTLRWIICELNRSLFKFMKHKKRKFGNFSKSSARLYFFQHSKVPLFFRSYFFIIEYLPYYIGETSSLRSEEGIFVELGVRWILNIDVEYSCECNRERRLFTGESLWTNSWMFFEGKMNLLERKSFVCNFFRSSLRLRSLALGCAYFEHPENLFITFDTKATLIRPIPFFFYSNLFEI